ncbi:hypothetical protein Nepgr_011501 [Nepenthes gracilis]|uniref:Uncharacterized protein n=1 Tax=Nepenthes gracilis TaxID=150966 RepID=A0AAD3XMD8_NEPGR|nr:hypothetical protein Nepgr_011501 [Nepenthes gracilis]
MVNTAVATTLLPFYVLLAVHVLLSWIFVYKLGLDLPGVMSAMIISVAMNIFGDAVQIHGRNLLKIP